MEPKKQLSIIWVGVIVLVAILLTATGTYLACRQYYSAQIATEAEAVPLMTDSLGQIPPERIPEDGVINNNQANQATEKAVGIIKNVYEQQGKRYLDIDYVEMFEGDKARQEAIKDGECSEDVYPNISQCIPNGRYVRNQNPKIRTFEISSGVKITRTSDFAFSSDGVKVVSYEEFTKVYSKSPYFEIEVVAGQIVKITEIFIP